MSFFFDILQTAYSNAYSSGLKKKYTTPKIYLGGKTFDLSKRWYVYYSYAHPHRKNKDGSPVMVRQPPLTMSINKNYKTKEERLYHLGILSEVVLELLKDGYSPYKNKFQLTSESLQYTAKDALDYALDLKISMLAETSKADYKSRCNLFKQYLEEINLADQSILNITRQVVNTYLERVQKKSSNGSTRYRNNTRIVLSALFGELADSEIIPKNIVKSIKILDTKSSSHDTYPLEVLEGLFNYMKENDPLLLLFVKFVSYNFLRPIEVCRLKLKDIVLSQQLLNVYTKNKRKGRKTKIIPNIIVEEIKNFDFSELEYFLFTPTGIGEWTSKETSRRDYFTTRFRKLKKRYNEYLKKEGKIFQLGSEYTVYSFRHTFITLLFRKLRKEFSYTETCDQLMLITGHATLKALKEYLKDIDAELPEDYSGLLVL